jgi:hydrogenase maturation protease
VGGSRGQGIRNEERGAESSPVTCLSSLATLIIGLGNPLWGDDGVGVRVAELLGNRVLPAGMKVVDGGTGGLDLVNLMEGWPRVIFVDAANMGREPGQFVRFALDEARLLGKDESLSIHDAGLREALLLAQALSVLPDEVVIYGVQPAHIAWDSGLSPEVEGVLPKLVATILEEIEDNGWYSETDRSRTTDH